MISLRNDARMTTPIHYRFAAAIASLTHGGRPRAMRHLNGLGLW
jgi:hypothetical protein